MLLAAHCCFKLLPSSLSTQIPDLLTLKPSSYATFYPFSLLMPLHFLKTPVPVLRGFLHPLVNLSDSNVRIKDLSKKRLICPSCYFFTETLSQPLSHMATCWTSSSPVPVSSQILYLLHLPSLQFTYSTFTANILQTYLDIQSIST